MLGDMTDFRLAERMGRLGTESAFEVLARAKALEAAGQRVIHLEIGEPDFPTADHVSEAAVEALRAGHTHYVPAPGSRPCASRSRPSSSGPGGCGPRRTGWW